MLFMYIYVGTKGDTEMPKRAHQRGQQRERKTTMVTRGGDNDSALTTGDDFRFSQDIWVVKHKE